MKCLLLISMHSRKKQKKNKGVSGFMSNWMDPKFLMGTILFVGLMLLLVPRQIMSYERFGGRPCKKVAEIFVQEDSMIEANKSEKRDNFMNESTVSVKSTSIAKKEKEVEEDMNKPVLQPYGNAAYLFIQMGAYRGGSHTFAVVGLASKPLHVFGKPRFECEWIPHNSTMAPVEGKAYKILPDWGYGRVYTVVVVNCTFSQDVGTDGRGGQLVMYAHHGNGVRQPEKIVALIERKGNYNPLIFTAPPAYDYLYCGSPLYGDVNPQRMREWMAYHAKFFGPRSHFVLYDAGGVQAQVRNVLEPWIRAGRVTLQDITQEEQYDGYYHNQFLVMNDCLHRYRFTAMWTFFFDIDEYLYVPGRRGIQSVIKDFSNYTQFTIEQYRMSDELCLDINDTQKHFRKWGFEKLVFRDVKRGIRRDRKYAVQARNAYATGVHLSQNIIGKSTHQTYGKIRYYHYHKTISGINELCRTFVNPSLKNNVTIFRGTPYRYDSAMKKVAASIKLFEQQEIGSRMASTAR